jgi:hypothetical protein
LLDPDSSTTVRLYFLALALIRLGPLAGNAYADCAGLVETSPDQTAVLQIHSEAKVPLKKIVIGKPAIQADAGAGYIAPPTLSSCIQMVKKAPGGWSRFPSSGLRPSLF